MTAIAYIGTERRLGFALRCRPTKALHSRPAEQSDGSGNWSATVATDRAFPAAVAELGTFSDELAIRHADTAEAVASGPAQTTMRPMGRGEG